MMLRIWYVPRFYLYLFFSQGHTWAKAEGKARSSGCGSRVRWRLFWWARHE